MSRHLTEFIFYKNTPLVDFQNTIHFEDNTARDNFFLEEAGYQRVETSHPDFNFIRDRSTVKLSVDYKELAGVNYCTFLSEFEPDTRFYAYVMGYTYINRGVTEVQLLIDPIMTYTQGDVLEQVEDIRVDRQHLPNEAYKENLWELKNNNDVLETHTKSYFYENGVYWKDFTVLLESTANLEVEFGTEDDPHLETSDGGTFDGISSPATLYLLEREYFKEFMEQLSKFPWIAQNLKSLLLIPTDYFDGGDLVRAQPVSFDFRHLYRLIDGHQSSVSKIREETEAVGFEPNDFHKLFRLDPDEEPHLLRSEYATAELLDFNGQQVGIDLGQVDRDTGFHINAELITGYHNELTFFVKDYGINLKNYEKVEDGNYRSYARGEYLGASLIFNNFDSMPMLLDNYRLSMAESANQRALAEDRLISNRLGSVFSRDSDLQSRFYDAASIVSNFSIGGLFGKFNDEREYYREQRAEMADLAISAPTLNQQSNENWYNIKYNQFGLTVKFSRPTKSELDKIRLYYRKFGYLWERENTKLYPVDSMSIANYVAFAGSWQIPGIDNAFTEMMKAQFENGVLLWHHNGTDNPMSQNLLDNERVK